MSILKLQVVQSIIKELSSTVRVNRFSSDKIPKFIFICGEQIINDDGTVKSREELQRQGNKRQVIIDKLNNNSNHNIVCVISEKIYNNSIRLDTLTFEELLAELSDKIIIIVESYGTVCELGAFTVKEEYLDRLLVINDDKYEYVKSFVNEGPVCKIKEKNEENYILAPYNYNLFKSNFQINEYIRNMKESDLVIIPNNNSKELDLKNFIYELVNIIELFQPIEIYELFYIFKKVKGFESYEVKNRIKHSINSPSKIISLMEKMELIKIEEGYIIKNGDYTCYNALFNINRDKYNNLRQKVVYEIIKKYPERFKVDKDADITINE
ncbi:MAG: retron St85 family effector protein [Clostridium sp.]|uniref:retron St85 family effector protein n=1 Tax=Clostridium sp. TaxID=1506 RepID=UPI002900EDBC|nr:retron St85 family effector protein [Clostridium sp.]MDU2895705.1 retron St85 family effector protein [Clostridium sp.]MDU3008097.1 retron St85 family effector protein [Clostridium sp.]MDU3037954.1 retron St85 family effector protein [Clostridium sp.]MDU3052930.1 retron St85 family effector protein [Clostridium sp.]